MRYVRNRLCTLLREVLILIAGLRNAFLHRNEDQLIKRVKYGNEMLEVTLKAIALCSMDRYLKSFTSLRTEAAASGFIKCVKSYISTGWRHGYIVCHYYRNGQSLGKSLPLFISETSEYSIQKRVNRLISSTISGRNKDLGRVRISTLRNENETFSQLNSITYIGVFLRLVTYSHLP